MLKVKTNQTLMQSLHNVSLAIENTHIIKNNSKFNTNKYRNALNTLLTLEKDKLKIIREILNNIKLKGDN